MTPHLSSNPNFVPRLKQSQYAVRLVGQHYLERLCNVVIPPQRIRPDESQIDEYRDHGDLYVNGKRFEVRHLRLRDFQSLADVPFKNWIVGTASTLDLSDPKPVRLHWVNRAGTVMAVLSGSTYTQWFVKPLPNPHLGGKLVHYYMVSKGFVRVVPIEVVTL